MAHITIDSQKKFEDFLTRLDAGETFENDTIDLITCVDASIVKNYVKTFKGYFNAHNNTLNSLSRNFISNNYGVIDSLIIGNESRISSQSSICHENYGTIKNCINKANINLASSNENIGVVVGGICGSNKGIILNCINYGNVTVSYSANINNAVVCGGVVGYTDGKIIHCKNYGNVETSSTYIAIIGGICGRSEYASILGCINYGSVYSTLKYPSVSNTYQETGGIIGRAQFSSKLDRCCNKGTIKNNSHYVGGIAGKIGNTDIYNMINYGQIISTYDQGYSCAAGIVAEANGVDKQRQFFNCINHGSVSAQSKYYTATAAGVCATINNYEIANLYNDASVSAQRVGGTATSSFEIQVFESDSKSHVYNKNVNKEIANTYIDSIPERNPKLLKWVLKDETIELEEIPFCFPVPLHGSVDLFVFGENEIDKEYNISLTDEESHVRTITSKSPIRINYLYPKTKYTFEVKDPSTSIADYGSFTTLTPTIELEVANVNYDNAILKQSCTALGVDECYGTLHLFSKDKKESHNYSVDNQFINATGLEEDSVHIAYVTYTINGKDFLSKEVNLRTKPIVPELIVIEKGEYHLKLQCKNYSEIQKINPIILIRNLNQYNKGNVNIVDAKHYYFDNSGILQMDSILYDYAPNINVEYTFTGEKRIRKVEVEDCKTSRWGGEGIIQLSKSAAMIHGLFGGMGDRVDNGGFDDKYDRARFYYRNALDSDTQGNNYIDGIKISSYDYAATIPLNSELYQYKISLQRSRYRDPFYNSRNGDWNLINTNNSDVAIVEPKFFNISYNRGNLEVSIIKGEETLDKTILRYKVLGYERYNDIILSKLDESCLISYRLSSIVPELKYLIEFVATTKNGTIYYSPVYLLENGLLSSTVYSNNAFITNIKQITSDPIKVAVKNKNIYISGMDNQVDCISLYDMHGKIIYNGYKNVIHIDTVGVYILKLGQRTYKIIIE